MDNVLDDNKLWLKISGSITFYLKSYDNSLSDQELLDDYLEYSIPDIDEDGVRKYLDKQSFKWVVVNEELFNKAKDTFLERLQKRRVKEPQEIKQVKKKESQEPKVLADVVNFTDYKKK